MTHQVRAPVWAVVAFCLLAGCSAQRRENYLRDRAGEHVYREPLVDIWPRMQAVLEKKGYSWREVRGRYVLETEWKENGGGTLGHSYTRYLVEGMRLKGGGSLLRVMRDDASAQPVAVNYAGKTGRASSAREVNSALQDMANSNTTGMTSTQRRAYRDLELELELLQSIDPEGAAALEAEAEARFPRAK